jgi:general secretion pathway protein I
MKTSARGFTLVEVLVALAIVATTLIAGLQSSAALTRMAQRQTERVVAQLCAENALAAVRLVQQLPEVGDTTSTCTQGSYVLELRMVVNPTPNPNFRRVQAMLYRERLLILQLSTVVSRY